MVTAMEREAELRIQPPPTVRDRLGRIFALEKELMRVQAARLPDVQSWSLKQQIGYHLFEDSEHAQALLTRRSELPGGRRSIDAPAPGVRTIIEMPLFEQGDYVFCSALYLEVKALLVDVYQQQLDHTTTASDFRSRQVFEQLLAQEERQVVWIQGALAMMGAVSPEDKRRGADIVEQIKTQVRASGGLLGDGASPSDELSAPRTYEMVKDARREPRQKATLEFELTDVPDDRLLATRLRQFAAYFREMAAAETVASLLWEAPETMPWAFFADTARHCWDEVRHCQAGQQRLEQLGMDIWQVPVQTGNYDIRARMPLLERYAYITQVEEAGSFTTKHVHEELFRNADDQLSADMVAYDIADERRHVAFGSKWIPEIQKALGDGRPMPALVEDAKYLRQKTLAALRAQVNGDGSY